MAEIDRTPRQIIGDDAYMQLVFEGYEVVKANELSRRAEVIERAKVAMREASQALEYSINTLDGVVALDDEDMGKDGGSSACQATIKINRRAMAKLAGLHK